MDDDDDDRASASAEQDDDGDTAVSQADIGTESASELNEIIAAAADSARVMRSASRPTPTAAGTSSSRRATAPRPRCA
jgi:hypothetical protein